MLKIKVFNYKTGEFEEKALTPETSIQGECIIGRSSSCDLVLASSEVSRVHGRIMFQKDQYYFTDLGSTDGSRINNQEAKANQNYVLKKEDLIRIGEFVLLIEAVETPPSCGDAINGARVDSNRQWTKGDLTAHCAQVIDETTDAKTFRFVADPPVLFTYKPGQFVTLELEINGEPVLRSYSISSTPSRPHTLEITVKRVPPPTDTPNVAPGLVSNWLHDHITVGSSVKLSGGPMGKFTCLPNPAKKLLMISAGSGITPMMSMSRWVYDTSADCDIVFLLSARSPRDVIFRQELELMAARLPNFRLAITTTRSEPGQAWLGFTGRLTEAMLQVIAPDFRERTVYVCGPDSFMQGVKAMLSGLAFPMQNYYDESFGPPKKVKSASKPAVKEPSIPPAESSANRLDVATPLVVLPPAPAPAPASLQPGVFFAQSGKEISCDGEESILELAEQEGVKIRSGCRQGVCGACKKRKLEGEVKYETDPDALDKSEQEAGYILTCVAYPVGRVLIEA